MLDRIEKIAELSDANARSVEDVTASAERLFGMSEKLSSELSKFKTI